MHNCSHDLRGSVKICTSTVRRKHRRDFRISIETIWGMFNYLFIRGKTACLYLQVFLVYSKHKNQNNIYKSNNWIFIFHEHSLIEPEILDWMKTNPCCLEQRSIRCYQEQQGSMAVSVELRLCPSSPEASGERTGPDLWGTETQLETLKTEELVPVKW